MTTTPLSDTEAGCRSDDASVPPGFSAPPPSVPPSTSSSGSASVLGILDVSHPYYIHPSESWGQSLVSTTLTEFNYSEWSMAITMVLDGKNKIGFVDGTISAPDPGQPLYPFWLRNNKLVLSWILRSVSPNIAKSILYSKTARAAWTVLRSRFSQGDVFKIADLQEKIFSLRQGNHSVTEYFTHLITLYDELSNFRPIPDCSCAPICLCPLSKIRLHYDQDRVIRFLRGLGEGYAGARSQVMLLDPLPGLDRVFAMMIQQERDLGPVLSAEFPSAAPDAQVMLSRSSTSDPALGPRAQSFKRPGKRPVCSYCGYVGHTVDVCYKKHGYPPGYQHKGKRVAQANAVSTSPAPPSESEPQSVQVSHSEWSQFQAQYQRMLSVFQPSDGASPSQALVRAPSSQQAAPPSDHDDVPATVRRVNAAVTRSEPPHDPDAGLPSFENDWYS
ncbi:Retrovirus-related Pol polyprotein from transposon RE1 [Linum grandiflorum]